MDDLDSLLTARQLQDLLQVDRVTIYRMLKDGRLQGFKMGGQWRFSQHAIEEWLQVQRASLVRTAPSRENAELAPSLQALPLSCMQAIQDVFAEALGVGAVTTTPDGTPITTISNRCEFCDLILGTPAGKQRCVESWREAGAGLASSTAEGPRSWPATCHAGLCYVWGQILVQDRFVAASHAGQFLRKSPREALWSARLDELSGVTGVAAAVLRQALFSVPVLDQAQQRKVPNLLQRVASTFSEIGEERLALIYRLQRIAEMTRF